MTALTAQLDRELGRHCRALAKSEGPAPALGALHRALGPSSRSAGHGGHRMLPVAEPADAQALASIAFDSGTVAVHQDPALDDGTANTPWALGAAWIRLGLTERLLHIARDHLDARSTAGEPLLSVSAVRIRLGEAAADLTEAYLLLDSGPAADVLPHISATLARAQRTTLRLLGAFGYVDAEPARLARAADLLADIHPASEVSP